MKILHDHGEKSVIHRRFETRTECTVGPDKSKPAHFANLSATWRFLQGRALPVMGNLHAASRGPHDRCVGLPSFSNTPMIMSVRFVTRSAMLAARATVDPDRTCMDQDAIQKIAQEIAEQLSNYSWQLLVVQAVLTVFAFGAGILFGEYCRTRAAKTDVDGPNRSQIHATAPTLDENWREREWANLRRMKLEVLLAKMHDCEHFAEQIAISSAGAQERDPLSELEVITTLYFPELKIEVDSFLDQCRERRTEAPSTTENVTKNKKMVQEDFKSARHQLSAAAQNLTTQIMGVTGQA